MNHPSAPLRASHSARLREVRAHTLSVAPDVQVHYEVLGADGDAPTLVLANGLGGRLYAWEPLVERFAASHRIVTWDYRGLFRSSTPRRNKALAVPHHAEDALAILDLLGVERATFVGWSMGVQVSLEAALEHPSRVERLVLLNGTHGHVFDSGLQPVVRIPGVHRLLHRVVETLSRPGSWLAWGVRGAALNETHLAVVGRLLALWRRDLRVDDMYRQYNEDVFGTSFENFLRLFQQLDAHSVYHLLPEVSQPTLVVSGGLDWLTPASLSREIAARIPGAQHLHLPRGSHFALLEYPALVLERIAQFLAARPALAG